jgi:hypothetical protein
MPRKEPLNAPTETCFETNHPAGSRAQKHLFLIKLNCVSRRDLGKSKRVQYCKCDVYIGQRAHMTYIVDLGSKHLASQEH